MKALIQIFFVLIVVSISACKKEKINNPSLIGQWKQTASLSDPGNGSGQWMPVSKNDNYTVVFNSNGKLEGNSFSDYVKYTVKDSVTLTFYKQNNTLQNYRYKIADGLLTMSPAGPIFCIEGCGIRFTKISN